MSKTYGVLIDEADPKDEAGHLWGYELFTDGDKPESIEKPMDEIIITAANYASSPFGANAGGQHFSWMGPSPFEEPKRPSEESEDKSIA